MQISDMYLVAALVSYGAEYVEVDRSNPRRQKFIFAEAPHEIYVQDGNHQVRIEKPTLDDVKIKFDNRMLWYPTSYPDVLRSIKSNIHGFNDNQ